MIESNGTAGSDTGDAPPVDELLDDRQIVVISNREPYSHDYETTEDSAADDSAGDASTAGDSGVRADDVVVNCPAGGLTSALDPVMQSLGGTWIAWGSGDADRAVVDDRDHVAVPPEAPAYDLRRVWFDEETLQEYYYGFSNQVLWPLCHGMPSKVRYDGDFWQSYRQVNERFADTVVEEVEDDEPIVWFHDYHFGLAPRMVRRQLPGSALLAHFWHIPWPPWDVFRRCPHAREVLGGLLSNDLVGVHTDNDRRHLVRCARQLLDAAYDPESGTLTHDGQRTVVRVAPLVVDRDAFATRAGSRRATSFWRRFADRYELDDVQVALGVDRLDYTKGIEERLDALERLWEQSPDHRGELTYVQKASESRSRIDAYQAVQDRVEERIGAINRRFGTDDWRPIVYYRGNLSKDELAGLYRNADIALVTPNRDGLNLVAKEYVASQVDGCGVLVLSDTAGVAGELDENALSVNPLDTESLAASIRRAVEMPTPERRRRMRALVDTVGGTSNDDWVRALFRPFATQSADSPRDEGERYALVE